MLSDTSTSARGWELHILTAMKIVFIQIVCCLLPLLYAKRMDTGAAQRLTELLQSVRVLADVPVDEQDVQTYFDAQLGNSTPDCPIRTPYFSCDAWGRVDALTLAALLPPPPGLHYYTGHVNASDFSPQMTILIDNFVGRLTALPRAASITIRNSLLNNVGTPLNVLFNTDVLILSNVTARDLAFSDMAINFSSCAFDNVLLRCPLPPALLPCLVNATNPPCFAGPVQRDDTKPLAVRGGTSSDARIVTCHVPPASGYYCDLLSSATRPYFPAARGFSTIDLVYAGRGEAIAFDVSTSRASGVLTRVELFDWRSFSWVVAVDRLQPLRTLGGGTESFALPPILTNRVRATFEQWYPPQHAIMQLYFFRSTWPELAKVRRSALDCAPPTSMSARSMLDETLADSYCIGRVCQLACSGAASGFVFGRTVKMKYLVIEGDEIWRGGELMATTSSNTRVYQLDDNVSDTVLDWGVRGARRVRLVGDPVLGGLPPPARLPITGRYFPGVLVMRTSAVVPSGGVFASLNWSGVPPPLENDSVVSIVSLANVTFASTVRGALWHYSERVWSAVASVTWSSIVTNAGQDQPARKLVVVGARLLVAVAASTTIHDGSVHQLLVNRQLVQTPIDALDVATGVWYTDLLQHRIENNISDIDVVQWNATTFGLVNPATSEAVLIDWRPFPYELKSCAVVRDCHECTAGEDNAEPCRWCSDRCTPALLSCLSNEQAVVDSNACTAVSNRTVAGASNRTVVSTALITVALSSSSRAVQTIAETGDAKTGAKLTPGAIIGLAFSVPLTLGMLMLAAAWLYRRSKRSGTATVSAIDLPPVQDSALARRRDGYVDRYDDVVAVRSPQALA